MHACTVDGSMTHAGLVRHFLLALSLKKNTASADNPGIFVWDISSPDCESMTIPVITIKDNGH